MSNFFLICNFVIKIEAVGKSRRNEARGTKPPERGQFGDLLAIRLGLKKKNQKEKEEGRGRRGRRKGRGRGDNHS